MTRKIHNKTKVSRTESTKEPRQPSRLEKNKNTHPACPTTHGPTRDVSGISVQRGGVLPCSGFRWRSRAHFDACPTRACFGR
jgi:hypothetical protein